MSKVAKTNSYESLKALYYSGKVKPSLNKILVELENEPKDIKLTLLACQCLVRTKDYEQLGSMADVAIKIDPKNAKGYYYKGVALHNIKGKEQQALINLNKALEIEPENAVFLKAKATTHLSLYTDYQLPLKFAEKHRDKGEESLMKILALPEQTDNLDYIDLLTVGDASITVEKNLDAKMYYIQAENAYNQADEADQDANIYKDIVKARKACVKLIEKFTE